MKAHTPPFDHVDMVENNNPTDPYSKAWGEMNDQITSALDKQEGGSHYKNLNIQPLEHTYMNYGYQGLKAAVHTKVDKYLLRNKDSEVQDIEKAIHCLQILLEKAREENRDE